MSDPVQHVQRIAGLFDAVSDSYDTVGVDFFQPIAAGLVDELNPQSGERWLDVGCGRGAVLLRASAAIGPEGRAVGIDISSGMESPSCRGCVRRRVVEPCPVLRARSGRCFARVASSAATGRSARDHDVR